ncbi:hypothetical protein evm_003316 [Chilo suppressalis]|nr:hypothetical protein evm_003316 [Chilo suppressalis]
MKTQILGMLHLRRKSLINLENKLQLTKTELNGLHSALRLTLFCGRMMGVVPLTGLMNTRSYELRFQFLSFYTILYFVSSVGQILMFIMSFYWVLENQISLTNMTNFLFYTSGSVSLFILATVCQRWPRLVAKVESIEQKLPPLSNHVIKLCNITMSSILFAALVEHLLSILYGVTVATACDSKNIAETFFRYDKPWIFTYIRYSLWKGILIEVFNIQSTFIWSYSDLLIMVISIYVTEHFKLHNKLMKEAAQHELFNCDEFRVQHMLLIRLVKLINETIGIYILNCFGSNLYWICTQLYFSMSKNNTGHFVSCLIKNQGSNIVHGIEHTIYYTYSFAFLVVRTMLVLLLAARVHSASTVPLILLYRIPNSRFNIEVERFIGQINNIKVALSGLDFFYVTKTMILTLLGTIVTYELVMLQFIK